MTRNLIVSSTALALIGSILVAGAGAAQAPGMETVIKARQAHYKEIGRSFKGVMDEFKKPDPSVAELQRYTAAIDRLAPQILSWFPKGSGPESGVKTAALATIWQKPAEFQKDANAFALQAHTFNATALSGNLGAIRAGIQPLGEACKTCHQTFRARDEH